MPKLVALVFATLAALVTSLIAYTSIAPVSASPFEASQVTLRSS